VVTMAISMYIAVINPLFLMPKLIYISQLSTRTQRAQVI
jgi:hypothetical protein